MRRHQIKKYQVWVGGHFCFDCEALTPGEARKQAREWLGVARLERGTTVCQIPFGYYREIVKMNQRSGFNASNL